MQSVVVQSESAVPSRKRHIWVATHKGVIRDSNQDRAVTQAARTHDANDSWRESAEYTCLWAAVADGMGGHEAGNIASEVVIDCVCTLLPDVRSEKDMADLAQLANRMVFQAMFSGEGRMRMGSTLVAVAVRSNTAIIVNVGDSRAYLASGQKVHLLTSDDTLPAMRGGQRQHVLTQSLGGLAFQTPISPHVSRVKFEAHDRLLLCSDGLTDMISENEIAEILLSELHEPAKLLIEAALRQGGRDNITAVVIGAVN